MGIVAQDTTGGGSNFLKNFYGGGRVGVPKNISSRGPSVVEISVCNQRGTRMRGTYKVHVFSLVALDRPKTARNNIAYWRRYYKRKQGAAALSA